MPVPQRGALGGLDEGKVHPLVRQHRPVHRALVGGHIHTEDLPLVGVSLMGEKQQSPPPQQHQCQKGCGGQHRKNQKQPCGRP